MHYFALNLTQTIQNSCLINCFSLTLPNEISCKKALLHQGNNKNYLKCYLKALAGPMCERTVAKLSTNNFTLTCVKYISLQSSGDKALKFHLSSLVLGISWERAAEGYVMEP